MSDDPKVELGYFGPDADGDWIVNVLGPDLSFAVADEEKAAAVCAAIAALASTDADQRRIVELEGALRDALDVVVDSSRDGTYSIREFNALRATLTKDQSRG